MRAFLRRNELGVEPVLELTLAPDALGAVALPHTVVLDADGRVVLRHRGAADWNTSEVTALLEHLAATASAAGPVSIYRGSVELSVGAPPGRPGSRDLLGPLPGRPLRAGANDRPGRSPLTTGGARTAQTSRLTMKAPIHARASM